MVSAYIKKKHAQYELCISGVCSREIIYMFLVSQVSGLVENFNIGNFSDTINVISVKLCMVVLHTELYLFITLSVTLTLFQGHSHVIQLLGVYPFVPGLKSLTLFQGHRCVRIISCKLFF